MLISGRGVMFRAAAAAALVTIIATSLLVASPVRADSVATTAVVLRIVDGDTIDVRDQNRGRLRIRVLGINTPETKIS